MPYAGGKLTVSGTEYRELAASFGDTMQGIDGPAAGTYYCTGEYGNPPYEGPATYQDLEITLPGVDGIGIKRLGFRGRSIFFRLAFVADTKADCETAKNAFFTAATALASFSVTLPGGTERPSCRIVHGSSESGQWMYLAGRFALLVDVQLKQMRLT